MTEPTRWIDAACVLAVRAGEAILDVAGRMADPEYKSDGSPVTEADLAAHHVIVAGLRSLTPDVTVLSEESAPPDSFPRQGAAPRPYWCVDPLDGTKEFLQGRDEYTVNIALVEGGQPIAGVVYLPATGILYGATPERGAWMQSGCAGPRTRLPHQRPAADAERTAVVSRSHPSAATDEFLRRHGITQVLRHGSSLKICAVAEGRADVYPRFGPTCFWDTAAGVAVAVAAGCRVTTTTGAKLDYRLEDGLKHAGFLVYRAERLPL